MKTDSEFDAPASATDLPGSWQPAATRNPGRSAYRHDHTQLALKRAIDLIASFALIVFLLPLLVLLGVAVKISSTGPVLYRRRVVGPRGLFDAYKFRTMKADADAQLVASAAFRKAFERNFKLKRDPRITRVGAFLRKYSLDELPQLANVLRGQMSLVGPRMITAAELEKYGSNKDLILSARPGITGFWQVNGRQEVSYAVRVEMDLYYLRNWSLWLDLKILFRTPLKVFRGEGAY